MVINPPAANSTFFILLAPPKKQSRTGLYQYGLKAFISSELAKNKRSYPTLVFFN